MPGCARARRDHGSRADRQKTRLMWLVEDWGTEKFREMVGQQMGGVTLRKGVPEEVPRLPVPEQCSEGCGCKGPVLVILPGWQGGIQHDAFSILPQQRRSSSRGLMDWLGLP